MAKGLSEPQIQGLFAKQTPYFFMDHATELWKPWLQDVVVTSMNKESDKDVEATYIMTIYD